MHLYIGNLHTNASEARLKDLFKGFGKINSVKIVMDMRSGQSKGFGFIEMDNRGDGLVAIMKLNDLNYMNQFIEVSEVAPKANPEENNATGMTKNDQQGNNHKRF